jgi:hypothetical protein
LRATARMAHLPMRMTILVSTLCSIDRQKYFISTSIIVDRVLSILKPYLTKVEGFDSLTVVSEDTYFDTDVMDVWESMYDSITPDFNMSQIEGKALAIDGLVDVKLQEKDFKL